MTIKEILYECKIGKTKPFPADSGIPPIVNNMMVYHDESLPDGMFPECKKCLTGKVGSYVKFADDGTFVGRGRFKECAIRQIPMEKNILNIEQVQKNFKDSNCPLCKKPIREIRFLRIPAEYGESVHVHHILEKRMKMVFGVMRMSQPERKYSYTNCKIPKNMEETEHMKDVKKLQKLMDTKNCPKCGKQIDAIELKLIFTQEGSIQLIHSNHYTHTFGYGPEYGYSHCFISNDEFHDLLLS